MTTTPASALLAARGPGGGPGAGRWMILLGGLLGIPLGIGAFTFHYAHGSSYLSSDPAVCVNCHVMRQQYDDWQRSSHHAAATCVDCHLPASFLAKYAAKALNGFNHSKAFTLQDFPEPIRITPRNAALLQENCVRCHADMVHGLVAWAGRAGEEEPSCVHCHRTAGHGDTVGLGGPLREDGE